MRRFTRLFLELERTTRTSEKVAALVRYFAEAPPRDAAWALHFLTGRRLRRAVSVTLLRRWVGEVSGVPPWLVDECFHHAGDLSETLALLLGDAPQPTAMPLHALVERRLLPLGALPIPGQRELVTRAWAELDTPQRLVYHKLMGGEFRVGVARTLVIRALAQHAGIDPAVMSHRAMARWEPTEAGYGQLLREEGGGHDPGRPYPFFLASPIEQLPGFAEGGAAALGDPRQWQAEWKWDGIRAQLIKRHGAVLVWSRGEELITDSYPEVRAAGEALPDGTALDGEVLAWRGDRPLPFFDLQRRLGRKRVQATLFDAEAPVVFMAYDLLELDGRDRRAAPLAERRPRLEDLLSRTKHYGALPLSPLVPFAAWGELVPLKDAARERGVEGLMLKRLASRYGVGRTRGDWWKWKIDPFTVDAVLIYAQHGHGRRAGLFTDYTFGVWHDGQLVPVAKAYSGLSDEEIARVDAFVRRHTIDRHGPVHAVEPVHVFELAFESIQASTRHRSGIALRFPRMARWRYDKKPADADTFETLRRLLEEGRRMR